MKPSAHLILLSLALAFTACQSTPKLDLPEPPVIDKFTATPATVARGGTVTLEWSTANATDIELNEVGKGAVAGSDGKLSGSTTVTLTGPSVFVLNASNSRGVKVTAIATATVEGASQQVMFAALPAQISPGQTVTLVWTAPAARSVTLTPAGGAALDLRGQVDTGSVLVTPTSPTRYTLTADGTTRTVDVNVTQGLTSFTASKTVADAGEMVTLSWKTVNATHVVLRQPGSGVIADVGPDGGTMLSDGTATHVLPAYPNGTLVPYQLTVEGAGSPITETRNVVIGRAPVITSFTGPSYAPLGGSFTLRWGTLNADTVEVATGGAVVYRTVNALQAADGGVLLSTPSTSTDYTLTALNTAANVSATKTLTQQVIGPTTVTTFTATPGTVAMGGSPVTLTWNVPNARRVVITDGAGHTVASAHGPSAETGTGTAYPNADTTYVLTADNTVGAPVTANARVQVTAPASFGGATYVLSGNPFQVSWTIGGGAGLQGTASSTVTTQAMSSGFVDISTTGTKLGFSSTDDGTATFTPQDFETFIYGSRVSGAFTASTNGFVALVPTAAARGGATTALPNSTVEANFLAPWWGDLVVPATGGVYWQLLNEAPERTLIVQWNHVTVKGQAMTSDLTFEVKVHQTGVISFEYRTLSNAGTVVPVVGVQGPANTAAVGAAPMSNGSMTFFGPTAPPLTFTLTTPLTLGGFIKLTNGYLRPSFTVPIIATGDIAVTELLYRPAAPVASTGEWLEITNRSAFPIDLLGWSVDLADAGTFTVDASTPLPANGSVMVGQVLRSPANDDVNTTFEYGPALAMPDNTGAVSLYNGGYRSTVTYSAALGGSDAGVSVNLDGQPHLVVGDSSSAAPHGINCSSTTPIGAQVPQQLATPGIFQRCGIPFTMSSIPVSYFDISGTGVPLFAGFATRDDEIASFDIAAAPFPYMGTMVSQITVSTNGWIVVKPYNSGSNLTNKTVPSTTQPAGATLAIFWDDLDTNLSGVVNDIYAGRVGPNVDPLNPGGHWVVQYHHWAHNSSQNDNYNFQVKLFDTGVIEYHYADMISVTASNLGNGNGATVWLDSIDGGVALVSSVNQPTVRPQSAIRFTP